MAQGLREFNSPRDKSGRCSFNSLHGLSVLCIASRKFFFSRKLFRTALPADVRRWLCLAGTSFSIRAMPLVRAVPGALMTKSS